MPAHSQDRGGAGLCFDPGLSLRARRLVRRPARRAVMFVGVMFLPARLVSRGVAAILSAVAAIAVALRRHGD